MALLSVVHCEETCRCGVRFNGPSARQFKNHEPLRGASDGILPHWRWRSGGLRGVERRGSGGGDRPHVRGTPPPIVSCNRNMWCMACSRARATLCDKCNSISSIARNASCAPPNRAWRNRRRGAPTRSPDNGASFERAIAIDPMRLHREPERRGPARESGAPCKVLEARLLRARRGLRYFRTRTTREVCLWVPTTPRT